MIIELFSLALTAEALKRNLSKSAFSAGRGGSLWAQILGTWGRAGNGSNGSLFSMGHMGHGSRHGDP